MNDCQYLAKCPIWEKLNNNVKYVWINSYCQGGKQDACARKQIKDSGEKPPLTLLPNNVHLPKELFSEEEPVKA